MVFLHKAVYYKKPKFDSNNKNSRMFRDTNPVGNEMRSSSGSNNEERTNGTRSSSNPRYIKSLENHAKSPLLGLFQRNLFLNFKIFKLFCAKGADDAKLEKDF